ncbi:MAG: hypothetical protein O9264_07770 [Leptospira sp.]|nr:hypothetical protein [Leptospira sp.]
MKRYLIPIIFFTVGLLLQFWLYFSWITLGLLVSSTLLLCLLIFSVSEMGSPIVESSDRTTVTLPEPVVVSLTDVPNLDSLQANHEMTDSNHEPIFIDEDPITLSAEIKAKHARLRFSEVVKDFILPSQNSKISSILYAYFDGNHFTESIWQKGSIVIDSEPNEIEWETSDESNLKRGLPSLSKDNQKLYLPLMLNSQVFGLVCMQTKDQFFESEINPLWLTTITLSEKLMEQREYDKALKDSKTGLLNRSHFYMSAKDRFYSQHSQVMVLLKFINTSNHFEFAVCLNEKTKAKGFTDNGLFQIEDQILGCFLPNQSIYEFSVFIQSFVEELDQMGYDCELALGHSVNKNVSGKFDQWIKQTFASLESSILSNAA